MHPQELMDLPYAGMAEKELRKRKQWQLTQQEKIENALVDLEDAIETAQNAVYEINKEWSAAQ